MVNSPLPFGPQARLEGRGACGIAKVKSPPPGLASLTPQRSRPSRGHTPSWSLVHTLTPGHAQCVCSAHCSPPGGTAPPRSEEAVGHVLASSLQGGGVLTRVGLRTFWRLSPLFSLSLFLNCPEKAHGPSGSHQPASIITAHDQSCATMPSLGTSLRTQRLGTAPNGGSESLRLITNLAQTPGHPR